MSTIKIQNVRLSFPALFEPKKGPEETSKPAYSATFILDKKTNAADIKAINDAIDLLVKEAFKGKRPPKVCLRDGSEKPDLDGYGPGVVFLSARNAQRQMVVDNMKLPMEATDTRMHAGCYVNAVIRLWAQDNKFGKRINASLGPVQFFRSGQPFGEKAVDANEVFDAIPGDAVL